MGKHAASFYAVTSLVHGSVALVVSVPSAPLEPPRRVRPPVPHELPRPQPQGITLARIDGPTTDEVTMRESGECEITPSTDVKYPQGSIASPPNQWLLIGAELW